MNPIVNFLRAGVALAVVLLAGLNGPTAPPHTVASTESPKPDACLAMRRSRRMAKEP